MLFGYSCPQYHAQELPNGSQGLLSEISNAANRPVKPNSDVLILALINKTKAKSSISIADFRAAGREDLAEKEEEQLAVLESYSRMVDKLERTEIAMVAEGIIQAVRQAEGKALFGDILKRTLSELAGRPTVKSEVVEIVKEALRKSP